VHLLLPEVDREAPAPLAAQIAGFYARAIAEGRMRVGDRLPPIREVAATLGSRRGQPARPEHPCDRRRIMDRRQHAPRARALRADQHVDAKHALQQVRPRQTLPATAATTTAVWHPQTGAGAAFCLLATYDRSR
jgi:DNA-binding transcriptional MocR family regulator